MEGVKENGKRKFEPRGRGSGRGSRWFTNGGGRTARGANSNCNSSNHVQDSSTDFDHRHFQSNTQTYKNRGTGRNYVSYRPQGFSSRHPAVSVSLENATASAPSLATGASLSNDKDEDDDDSRLLDAVSNGSTEQIVTLVSRKVFRFSQDALNNALIEAVKQGWKFIIQKLIALLGVPPLYRDKCGNSALLTAVKCGYLDIARFLIKKGADVNAANNDKDTPLIVAIRPCGASDMIKLLLSKSANVHAQNKEGNTALMRAVEVRDIDSIKLLLDAGAKAEDYRNKNNETACSIAAKHGLGYVLSILKEDKNKKYNKKNRRTCLTKAVTSSNVEAVSILVDCQFIDVNKSGQDGSALMQIVRSLCKNRNRSEENNQCKFDIIKLLLQNGAKVEEKQSRDGNALILATKSGHFELAKLLCEYGPLMNALVQNRTALMIAAESGRVDLLNLLLDSGADPNFKNNTREDALMIAFKHGQVGCAQALIARGAKVDFDEAAKLVVEFRQLPSLQYLSTHFKVDVNKHNLLHTAVSNGDEDLAKMLIDMGADVNKLDGRNSTPLLKACSVSHALVKLLIDKGADVNLDNGVWGLPIVQAVSSATCSIQIINLLIESGADVNKTNSSGATALLICCTKTCISIEIVDILLNAGADPNKADPNNVTALMCATRGEHSGCIERLLEKGANIEARNKDGETAFLYAARTGNVELVRLLKKLGANAHVVDSTGGNAVLHATTFCCSSQCVDTIKFLAAEEVDVNKQNDEGYSSLMLVVQQSKIPVDLVMTLLDVGVDVNVVNRVTPESQSMTALSCLIEKASSYKKGDITCVELLLRNNALASLPSRCLSVLHKMIILDKRQIVQLLVTKGMGPSAADLRPVMYRLGPFLQMQMLRFTMMDASPLSAALASGNVQIARYLSGNWFLTPGDLQNLARNNNLRDYLCTMDMTECVEFVDNFSTQPASLLKQAFVAVSAMLGSAPGREERVRQIPLPSILQDKLLFKHEDVTMDMSSEGRHNLLGIGASDDDDDDDDDYDEDDYESLSSADDFLEYDDPSQFFYDSDSDKYLFCGDGGGVYDSDTETFMF